jgi:hypothetical protein
MIFFQPFGVNNYNPSEKIGEEFLYGITAFTLIVSVVLLINEFLLKVLLKASSLTKFSILWFLTSGSFLGSTLFLVYNILGNWHDFSIFSYLDFVKNMGILYTMPYLALHIYVKIRDLNESLNASYNYNSKQSDVTENLVFTADNQKDNFSVKMNSLVYINSDDNYVTIYHLINSELKKTLLRKSLKSIQEESIHENLFRCHRSFLINIYHLNSIKGNRNKLQVYLNNVKDSIPVSRAYIEDVLNLIDK